MSKEAIYGKLNGLKPSQLKQLRRLYHQRLPGDCLTTVEFAQRLAAIGAAIKQPVCAYVNRRGRVVRVGVGTLRATQIPRLELPRYGAERLCGIRCIITRTGTEPPDTASLTAMAIQRLDALVVLLSSGEGFQRRSGGATGYVQGIYLAHLRPDPKTPWSCSSLQSLDWLVAQDFPELLATWEAAFQQEYAGQRVDVDRDRVVIVGLVTADLSLQRSQEILAELAHLVTSAGGEVLQSCWQQRPRPHPQTVIGAGKIQELALLTQTLGANLVVFDRELSAAQVRNLETQIGLRVLDRTEVILDIFAQRAQTRAGQLQVELAHLEYMLPRLVGQGQAMSRLGGGIGTRGPGETKLETERRVIQRRLAHLQRDVDQLQAHRARLRQRRQLHNVPSIAVVGYTNAGKSTLLNALTNAAVYTADQLFATLDPTTRKLAVLDPATQLTQTILLTDTVGFIHELPPSLLDAFRATLEELTEADGLIHLVDLSHSAWQRQIQDVTSILDEIALTPRPTLLVFNKIDAVSSSQLAIAQGSFPHATFISAQERLGLETLRQRLAQLAHYAMVS